MVSEETHWPLPSPVPGPELDWVFHDQRVVGLRWNGEVLTPEDPRFMLGAFPVSETGAPFPVQFRYDPATGGELKSPPSSGQLASYPGYERDGFPAILSGVSFRSSPEKLRVTMPAGAICVFCAGAPSRLFCLTSHGNLSFRLNETSWVELSRRLAPPTLPSHAFGVCAFAQGFAMALGNSAVIGRLVPGLPEPLITPHDFGDCVPCGTPALIEDDIIVFPVARGTSVKLARYQIATGKWLDDMIVEGQRAPGGGAFDVPVQNLSRIPDTFWCGETDYLVLTSAFDRREAHIRSLSAGMRAVRGAPRLRDERETIYVLASSDAHYAFVNLAGRPVPIPLDGPHLSAGEGRYIGRYYYPSLWSDEITAFQIEAGAERALVPLAYGRNERGRTESALLVLADGVSEVDALFSPRDGKIFSGSLYWHAGAQLHQLNITLRFRSRYDIILYRDAGGLVVGTALTGDFYRFRLPSAGTDQ
ncbi:hypothetical protein MKI84_02995 [Ancylobacter sp. A5.8]|uniref:hypothetical protein n=1 Tax=Ancylobacter gelatini TaxID=2919920 RepID=UPI001F4DEEAA|nr:hypothetical protein [Ancylobacter gelatini]MCJ8141872.1 hypothetical protein [Ancylobacter gelatini]